MYAVILDYIVDVSCMMQQFNVEIENQIISAVYFFLYNND